MNRRVLYLADTLDIGGAERQLSLLVKYLPTNWEPRVWSLKNGPFAEVIRSTRARLDIRERRRRYDLLPIFDLWKTVIRWRPSLVHSWGWVCSAAVAPLCRILSIPWVDGSIRIGRAPKRHLLRSRFALALANRVVANSQAGLDALQIPPEKGRVVYNGFDPERLPLTEPVGRKPGTYTAIMVGRMSPAKDFGCFFRAARNLCADPETDGWHFQALGVGPDRAALMDSAADLVEMRMLDFPDAGLEVLPYVRQANVGVLLSESEGCSNSLLEYMACGLPVICNDSAGNRELVVDGETGFIVASNDAKAVAERLRWLRAHPEAATSMGRAARQRFLNEFSVESFIEKTLRVYKELVPS